jgi:hypothetical protein
MYKDSYTEHEANALDHRDVEQVCLSWHLIQEGDSNYKENLIKILDKRYVENRLGLDPHNTISDVISLSIYLGFIAAFPTSCLE